MGKKGKAIIIVLAVLLVAETGLLAYTFVVPREKEEGPRIYGEVGPVEDRGIDYLLENCGVDQLPIEADVIPDAETALKIGTAILDGYFSEEDRDYPTGDYNVTYNDAKGVWLISDARTDIKKEPGVARMGGGFAGVILRKSDAQILALYRF